ncbi:dynamin-related protein 4C-like [Hibiscus syriacus]|uniref:dynamin-related protein 4C-like n=1 Tax=Hibiscus syriacus TaxID=106335 RepID=UPI001923419D|nr:dynamin-related protein 4C-like [Hibiscus syriacus]
MGVIPAEEFQIVTAINIATDEVAGRGKSIYNTSITLVVKKHGIPDLTMIDLPGLLRVPVHATDDFSTCESIRMSQQVDKTGESTLAVVTKADKEPEELLEKVTANDVNIGFGYVCVRNHVGDASQEEARKEEAGLFETNTHLSSIDKSMVGVPVDCEKNRAKLKANVSELEKMPEALSSIAEATQTLMRIIGAAKESLKKFLWRREFDEFPYDNTKHGTARFVEMLNKFSDDLHNCKESNLAKDFLAEEIKVLEDFRGIKVSNYLPSFAAKHCSVS